MYYLSSKLKGETPAMLATSRGATELDKGSPIWNSLRHVLSVNKINHLTIFISSTKLKINGTLDANNVAIVSCGNITMPTLSNNMLVMLNGDRTMLRSIKPIPESITANIKNNIGNLVCLGKEQIKIKLLPQTKNGNKLTQNLADAEPQTGEQDYKKFLQGKLRLKKLSNFMQTLVFIAAPIKKSLWIILSPLVKVVHIQLAT